MGVNTFQRFIITNGILLITFFLFSSVTVYLLIHTGILHQRKKSDLLYDSDLCINGEYCDFCDDKCICKFGWAGEYCDVLESPELIFYGTNWWNFGSECIFLPEVSGDPLVREDCEEACEQDDECKAYIWNPCKIFLESCIIRRDGGSNTVRRNGPPPPPCCDANPEDETCCVGECKFVKDKEGTIKPLFDVGYELIPEPSEIIIPPPPRRNIENGLVHPIPSQEYLYVKNGQDCFGSLCHFNDKYGLVFIDEETHFIGRSLIKSIIFDIHHILFDDEWFMENLNVSLGINSKTSILEITEMPILQTPRLFDINQITVISSSATLYNSMLETDFMNYNLTNQQIKNLDLSESIVKPEEKYDVVFLLFSMYGRKSLPILLTNAYNHVKSGGYIIIRDKDYSFINSTVLHNWCALAGIPKKQFTEDFFSLFETKYYSEESEEIEPKEEDDDDLPPFLWKNNVCWSWSDDFYHPNHAGNWFYFVGKK